MAYAAAPLATQALLFAGGVGAAYLVWINRQKILGALSQAFKVIAHAARVAWEFAASVMWEIGKAAYNLINGVWSAVKSAARNLWDGLKWIFSSKEKRAAAQAEQEQRIAEHRAQLQADSVELLASAMKEAGLTGTLTPEGEAKLIGLVVEMSESSTEVTDEMLDELLTEHLVKPQPNRNDRRRMSAAEKRAAKFAPPVSPVA